ncbi:nucleoside deaminase [Planktotalea arctica]|uniref:nucleoside deaminase n=1 Tax=Planktotalea arctica TaxID=1481893 RepID=UPI000A1766B9|nr:nucleoside deaminase [Planktotalea arctica]
MSFTSFMKDALEQARLAGEAGEVPVGAVVVRGGEIIGRGRNATRSGCDPSAHAEIVAIRAACAALGQDRLSGCDLYVTLEPCAMCAGAIAHARIARLYFGAADPKSGGVTVGARVFERAQSHHAPEVYDGIGADEASALLKSFFAEKRG